MNMKKILSIDGGGIRGVAVARFLYLLEEHSGRSVYSMFHLFAGASIGGIIALALAVKNMDTREIAEIFSYKNAQIIMPKSPWDRVFGLLQGKPKYDGKGKTQILQSVFGEMKVSESIKPVIVTTYDIERRKTFVIKSCTTNEEEKQIFASAAADATSAAPAYFPPVNIMDNWWLIDGGVVSNNPSMCAFAEARRLWPEDEIKVLSIGTGTLTRPIDGNKAKDFGALGWMRHDLLGISMDTSMTDYQGRILLGNNYVRVNSELIAVDDDMDNCTMQNIASLKRLGEYWWDVFGLRVLEVFNG